MELKSSHWENDRVAQMGLMIISKSNSRVEREVVVRFSLVASYLQRFYFCLRSNGNFFEMAQKSVNTSFWRNAGALLASTASVCLYLQCRFGTEP